MSARADAHRRRQARLAATVAARLRRLWAERVDPGDIAGSWQASQDAAWLLLRAGITAAAAPAETYVAATVTAAGRDPAPQARLVVDAFADAVDRRTLMSPVARTLRHLGEGWPPAQAMVSGQWLAGAIGRDTVADTGRAADTVASVAEPQIRGYVRVVSGATCGRCAILAGRVYRVEAFDRHPGCDCGMHPLVEGEPTPPVLDARSHFDSLSKADQNRYYGANVADRIRTRVADVGDISTQRFNREVNVPTRLWQRERRSTARRPPVRTLQRQVRSRDELLAALTEHGYLTAA